MNKSEKKQAASIVWFEIPADNPERATAFYNNLFGWNINPFPGGAITGTSTPVALMTVPMAR
jgi:Predicted enzyme related to lactoylglutathione lyase